MSYLMPADISHILPKTRLPNAKRRQGVSAEHVGSSAPWDRRLGRQWLQRRTTAEACPEYIQDLIHK